MKSVITYDHMDECICNDSLQQRLVMVPGIYGVDVDRAAGCIVVEHTDEIQAKQLIEKLTQLGLRNPKIT